MSVWEETQTQLSRFERRRSVSWMHKVTPILATQACCIVAFIKTWDEYFDVSGIVMFNLMLLLITTWCHFAMWEILLHVRSNICDSIKSKHIFLDTGLQRDHRSKIYDMGKTAKTEITGRNGSKARSISYLTKPVQIEECSISGSSGFIPWSISPSSISIDLPSSSSSSTSSSSYCVLSDKSSQTESSSSSSFLVVSSSLSSSCSSLSSGMYSDSTNCCTDSDEAGQYKSIPPSVSLFKHTIIHDLPKASDSVCISMGQITWYPHMPSIPTLKNDGQSRDPYNQTPEAPVAKSINRFKSLQDIYIVIDLFKALVCIDVLSHLWFYYSLYLWRLTLMQMLQVFLIPSVVIVAEVSLTVICFIP